MTLFQIGTLLSDLSHGKSEFCVTKNSLDFVITLFQIGTLFLKIQSTYIICQMCRLQKFQVQLFLWILVQYLQFGYYGVQYSILDSEGSFQLLRQKFQNGSRSNNTMILLTIYNVVIQQMPFQIYPFTQKFFCIQLFLWILVQYLQFGYYGVQYSILDSEGSFQLLRQKFQNGSRSNNTMILLTIYNVVIQQMPFQIYPFTQKFFCIFLLIIVIRCLYSLIKQAAFISKQRNNQKCNFTNFNERIKFDFQGQL
eukprot:TRINITY_DN2974_c2_g1_i3.p1 TRINITY_DN2974_c2_g1~~TRINITY_DN2974_c2_g1_i3.p1  ORF type:complete len:253 (+),score=-32.99 TRINITY_DN2974_c2_g1_i3:221-979(+)